jgi:hypothetical protein
LADRLAGERSEMAVGGGLGELTRDDEDRVAAWQLVEVWEGEARLD